MRLARVLDTLQEVGIPGQLAAPRIVGRYALHGAIAAGGMATVHFGRLLGPVGFSRTVAIKRLHAHFASDPEFVAMFLEEARLAARIRHPNVVPTLDVVTVSGELFLVLEYVPGESLARLIRASREGGNRIPVRIVSSIMADVLHGLHAAHEAKTERGEPLQIVHRDVSPQNVLVGTDGAARVLDFGVAKAAGRLQQTREGQIKGKLSYIAPEQLRGAPATRQSDIYAAGVLLWELLTGERLFSADNEGALLTKVLEGKVNKPSTFVPGRMDETMALSMQLSLDLLDDITMSGLNPDPARRYATAREMAVAIERAVPPATASEVSDWVEATARDVLLRRADLVAEIESSPSVLPSLSELRVATEASRHAPPDLAATRPDFDDHRAPPDQVTSQMSSISVARSRSDRSPQPSRAGLVVAVTVMCLVIAVVGTAVVLRARTLRSQATAAVAHDTVGPPPGAPATPLDDPGAPAAAPAASSAAPLAIAIASASASAPPASGPSGAPSAHAAPPPAGAAARQTRPRSSRPASVPPPDCNPPYTWDAEGRKHFKPNCI